MRRLLRGRHRERRGVAASIAAFALLGTVLAAGNNEVQSERPSLRITSPLGRTGIPGTIRIVARADGLDDGAVLGRVDFYVDQLFLANDTDGPPYETLWEDEDPFVRREIKVRAELASGAVLEDRLTLEPLVVTEAAHVNAIEMEASVLDKKGHFVRDLTATDFEVLENSKEQVIDVVSQKREPALFALLVDSSQSMALRAQTVRATAKRLLIPLAKDDQVVVLPFAKRILNVTGPTTDHATVLDAIAGIQPSGGTAILDALRETAGALSGRSERRAIVLITDGYDEHSVSEFDDAIAALRKSDVTVYVVGVGGIAGISLKGEQLLKRLAEETGGRAWFPRDDRQLGEIYENVASDVQQKYLITYTPSNQQLDGAWRTVAISARNPDLRVRARTGYTAPVAPPIHTSLEFTAVGPEQTAASVSVEDLDVLEDGVPQTVDTFQEAVLPVTIMLALDASGSMQRSAEKALEAARGFVMALRQEDEMGLIMFADRANYMHSPGRNRDYSFAAIDKYKTAGGTALNDALYDSLAQIGGVKGRRVVVVMTDGRDENAQSNGPGSLRSWDDVLRKLQQTDAAVYAVGIGSNVDRARLQELADRSGGAAYFPADVGGLAANYSKILDELRRRYVVGYESTNRIRNGNWRKVDIRVRHGDATIRSRGGYFAPTQ
jgi:Ca-activated chloride channel homolog